MEMVTHLMIMNPSITAIKTISEAGTTAAAMMVGGSEGGFSVGETVAGGAGDLCMTPVVVST